MHVLGGSGSEQVPNYPVEFAKCIVNFSNDICLTLKQRYGTEIVARTLVTSIGTIDCPPAWVYNATPDESAKIWMNIIGGYLPSGYDWYEIQNECGVPAQGWEYWAEWSIEMAQLINKEKGGKKLAFSFGPGNPEIPEWPKLTEYLKYASASGNGVAVHASPFATFTPPEGATWINHPYIAGRLDFVCDTLKVDAQFDCRSVKWIITEIGLSDGYSGLWDYAWSCEQIANAFKTTTTKLEGMVYAFNWWNIGKLGRWTDDSRCLGVMLK